MSRIRRCLRTLAVAVGAAALTASSITPALARGGRRPAERPQLDRSGSLVRALEHTAAQRGRNLVGFETLRLMYRYAHESYGRGGPDRFDLAAATAWSRSGVEKRRVQALFAEKVLPFEARLRRTFVPEVGRLPFDASREQVMYAMSGSGDDLCLGEAAGNVCREVAGKVWDSKHPEPTLHSAYGHLVRNNTVHFEGIDADIECAADADCAPFAEGAMQARCGTGDDSYDLSVGDLEQVDGLEGVCVFGPQWHVAQNLRLQMRNMFDTDAQVVLLRVEEPDGTPTGAAGVEIMGNGQLVVPQIGGGDLTGAGLHHVVTQTQTWGGVAGEYLTLTGQAEFYHPNTIQALNWPDLVDLPLPEDLLPGLYEVRVVYRPAALLDTLNDQPSYDYFEPLLPDEEHVLTNPIRVRVSGQGDVEVPHRFEVVRAKVCEPQETEDDPRIDSLMLKVDLTADELNAALAAIELDGNPAVIKLIDNQAQGDDLEQYEVMNIGAQASFMLKPTDAVVAINEIWEYDGGEMPPSLAEGIEAAISATISIASLAVAEYGLAAVAEFCVEGWTCAVVVAVIVAAIITMELWEYFTTPEFLGRSMAVYSYDEIRLLTHASQLGLTVDDVQALHDGWPASNVLLPSLAETSGSVTLPDDWPESGTIEFTDRPRMDGQSACGLSENGGFVTGQYDEFRVIEALNETPWPDDSSTYVIHHQIKRFD